MQMSTTTFLLLAISSINCFTDSRTIPQVSRRLQRRRRFRRIIAPKVVLPRRPLVHQINVRAQIGRARGGRIGRRRNALNKSLANKRKRARTRGFRRVRNFQRLRGAGRVRRVDRLRRRAQRAPRLRLQARRRQRLRRAF